MLSLRTACLAISLLSLADIGQAPADSSAPKTLVFDERFTDWPLDLKINGRILIDHGTTDFDTISSLLPRFARDKKVVCFGTPKSDALPLLKAIGTSVGDGGPIDVNAIAGASIEDMTDLLRRADVLVLLAGASDKQTEDATILAIQPKIKALVAQGGTLIVNAPMAKRLEAVRDDSREAFQLLPDCLLEFVDDEEHPPTEASLSRLSNRPKKVGVRVTEGTMMMLSGRKITCYGSGSITCMLPSSEHQRPRIQRVLPVRSGRMTERNLIDLTGWRRDAIDRTLERFPPIKPMTPFVPNGTLVIVGGGGMPKGLMSRLVELAGGTREAKLVYVPCSESDEVASRQRTVDSWKAMGVKNATFIHTKDRMRANADAEFLKPLKDATGLWFGGGRQWNFSDSYYGTQAHRLMKQVLDRGGVIGGSSAGASIQGRYLARATPIGNTRIMAPGYERGGLGFLSGVAIDQHFSQRRRQKDMSRLVDRYPQLLGIGIDEATAIVVQKSRAEVVGRGRVFFYDRSNTSAEIDESDNPTDKLQDYRALAAGSIYDLASRKVIKDARDARDSRDADTNGASDK